MTIYSHEVLLFLFEPVCCSISSSNCCFLTCIQVSQQAGQVVWYLMKVKEESENMGLKFNIQKTKSWHLVPSFHQKYMGKQWKQCQTLFWGGSKMTANGECSHEIKRRLLFRRKVMTNLSSIWKNRDITIPTKVHLIKSMAFPVVMYGWESWTVKKAENLMLLNCGVGEDFWESLGLQGDTTSPS